MRGIDKILYNFYWLVRGTKRMENGTPWIIDVIAPFGGAETVVQSIKDTVFDGQKIKVVGKEMASWTS